MYEGFRIRVPVLAAAIVFAAAGCTSGTVSPPLSTSHSSAPATVQLPEGDVRDSFAFEAPDPRTHYFDVGVTMPIATQLEITFVTADGKILRILDPDKAVAFCAEEDGRLHCLLHYSILDPPTRDLDRSGAQTLCSIRRCSDRDHVDAAR